MGRGQVDLITPPECGRALLPSDLHMQVTLAGVPRGGWQPLLLPPKSLQPEFSHHQECLVVSTQDKRILPAYLITQASAPQSASVI